MVVLIEELLKRFMMSNGKEKDDLVNQIQRHVTEHPEDDKRIIYDMLKPLKIWQ
jgi:hypothetical protein